MRITDSKVTVDSVGIDHGILEMSFHSNKGRFLFIGKCAGSLLPLLTPGCKIIMSFNKDSIMDGIAYVSRLRYKKSMPI